MTEPKCDALPDGTGEACQPEPVYPKITGQGFDLAQYTRDYVLPEAAAFCEQGQRNEIAAQRDAKPAGPEVIWLVEVAHGLWETTSTLPHGMPPLQVRGKPGQLQMCDV